MKSQGELAEGSQIVRLFNCSLLWPLQLEPLVTEESGGRHWELLDEQEGHPWRRIDDEFTSDAHQFSERHYREFVSFLPYVQRFLYGEGRSSKTRSDDPPGDSPMRVFRRKDVHQLRITLREGDAPILLRIVHIDLYFFHDLDVVTLNVEIAGENLPFSTVRDILFRFGRAYPAGWDESGGGVHNSHCAEWLDANGGVLAVSDSASRSKFLEYVCAHRSPCITEHWAWLLKPLVLAHSDQPGDLRYRLIEYHRMPAMAYLALDNPRQLGCDDWVRIGLATVLHPDEPLPACDPQVREFVPRYCQDRYWSNTPSGPNTRLICTGSFLALVGEAGSSFYVDAERGMLAQFRHQHFIVFLIAHLHRAALLVFSEVLVDAINDLDITNDLSVRRFKRRIRANFEIFLRFTHRYWFHELSERPQLQSLYRMCATHLRNDGLYAEVRDEISEMSVYLDSDSTRRQSNMVVRLTVITILGMIATVTTGYFGMNIISFMDGTAPQRLLHGIIASALFSVSVFYAVAKSKQLSDFLEALADDRLSFAAKTRTLVNVFKGRNKI